MISKRSKNKDFPSFFNDYYCFYDMKILGTPCLLMEVIQETVSLDQLQKHIKQVEAITSRQIVLLYKSLSRYRRKSFIEHRIAFVIEDGQMYLPFIGLDLKKTREQTKEEVKQFSTPAQMAYLFFLYHQDTTLNQTQFAKQFHVSIMTASRALNELYQANLLTYTVSGKTNRSKEYHRIANPEYFLDGKKYLKTPVRKTIYTKTIPEGSFVAGLDALAKLSMLNPSKHNVVAIDEKKFNKEKIEIVSNLDMIRDNRLVEVQLWDYDPALHTKTGYVDVVSLYASLKKEKDERVEQALEEVLRGKPWYTD